MALNVFRGIKMNVLMLTSAVYTNWGNRNLGHGTRQQLRRCNHLRSDPQRTQLGAKTFNSKEERDKLAENVSSKQL